MRSIVARLRSEDQAKGWQYENQKSHPDEWLGDFSSGAPGRNRTNT